MKELLRDAVSVMETWWARFPQDMSASDRAVLTRMQAEIDAPEKEPFAWAWQVKPESDFQKRKGGKSGVWLTNPADDGINIHSDKSILNYKWTLLYTKPQPVADLTDEQVEATWNGLQERRRAEAAQFIKDQTGSACGVCGAGALFQDSNGYNNFMRCNKCNHVPLYINGADVNAVLAAQKGKA